MNLGNSVRALLTLSVVTWARADESISKLPDHIKPPASGLALIADFAHASTGAIPVYLINRSGQDLTLNAQDRDVYLKLEYQDLDSQWKRAQPHGDSWCGNSYMMKPVVHNDCFITIPGYQPAPGEVATIRYQLYRQSVVLTSNAGPGIIRRQDVEDAQSDDIALSSGDFSIVAAVARGSVTQHLPEPSMQIRRRRAIMLLGKGTFDHAKSEEVLREIVASGEEPHAAEARAFLDRMK